jgi:hypothetical protein
LQLNPENFNLLSGVSSENQQFEKRSFFEVSSEFREKRSFDICHKIQAYFQTAMPMISIKNHKNISD